MQAFIEHDALSDMKTVMTKTLVCVVQKPSAAHKQLENCVGKVLQNYLLGKWTEQEKKILLSLVAQPRKTNTICTHSQVVTSCKAKDNQTKIHSSREAR